MATIIIIFSKYLPRDWFRKNIFTWKETYKWVLGSQGLLPPLEWDWINRRVKLRREIGIREKESSDDQGRFFSYLNWSSALIFRWPLSLVYVPNTQEQGVFYRSGSKPSTALDDNLSRSDRAARPAGLWETQKPWLPDFIVHALCLQIWVLLLLG